VIEVCRTHFKEVNNGSLDDPRLTTIVQEAEAYLVRIPEKRYDLIVADLTDPYDTSGQPGELAGVISTEGSCLSLKSHMNSGGILAVQTGGLTANPEVDSYHNALIEGLRRHFKKVETAYEYIRSFDQVWSFTLASDYPYDVTGLDPDSVLLKRGISGLRHYDTVSHRKAFQRPRQIRDLIG
jgi:spermidine synthase